jgi:hypothetical protein
MVSLDGAYVLSESIAVAIEMLVQPSKRSSVVRPKRAAQVTGTAMKPTAGRSPLAMMASTIR